MSELRLKTAALAVSAIFCVTGLSGCGGNKNNTVAGTFTVGGTVSGMSAGTSIILSDNGADNLTVTANGIFIFPTKLVGLSGYRVAIVTNPLNQICSLNDSSVGTITDSVTNITVSCNPSSIVVSTVAGQLGVTGSTNGTGTAASFNGPIDIAVDTDGNAYVAERISNTIRKITREGVVSTFAGTAGVVGSADKTGAAASFNEPTGVAVDVKGNVYVADSGNNTIRKITREGVVSTLAGLAGVAGSTTDVSGTNARFSSPARLAVDTDLNVYVTDRGNSTIRKITEAGLVSTIAGTPGTFGSANGTAATASFFLPIGIAVDASHNIYIGDGQNTIRKISAGVVSTLAGTAGVTGATDGNGGAASFNNIGSLAVDSAGNVYVADQANNLIRRVSSSGSVTVFSGIWGHADSIDGTGGAAGFRIPTGIAMDNTGKNLFVTDYASALIRKITLP